MKRIAVPVLSRPNEVRPIGLVLGFFKVQNVVCSSIVQEESLLQLHPGSGIQGGIQDWILLITIYGTSSGRAFYLFKSSLITLARTWRKFSTTYWIFSSCQRKQIGSEFDTWTATDKFKFLKFVWKMKLKNYKTAPSIQKILEKIAKVVLSLLSIL